MKFTPLRPSGKPWPVKPRKPMKSRHRAIPPPTPEEQDYQDRARALGCVVCVFRIAHGLQPEELGQCGVTHIHHINGGDHHGQKQVGQAAVVALGAWHHDGEPRLYWSDARMIEVYGPTFKRGRTFRVWTNQVIPGYGRGTEAWQKYQDELLARGGQ